MSIQDTLNERQSTHGDFADNARVSQALKKVMRDINMYYGGPAEIAYTDIQKETIDMICLKLSRIASNPNVADHWRDIAGYATLAEKELVDKQS